MLYRINIPTNKITIGTQKPLKGIAERLLLKYLALSETPRDRGAWQAIVYGATRVRHDWATKHST